MKTAVLLSGGMDSAVLLGDRVDAGEVPLALFFHYGAKHNDREAPFAERQARNYGIAFQRIDLPFVRDLFTSDLLAGGGEIPEGHYEEPTMKQTVVPFRNAIMLSIAAGVAESAGAEAVAIAAHSGDHAIYPDCREPFMSAMAAAMEEGTYAGIQLLRPFIHFRKEDIAARGAELDVDFSGTWSCYKGGDIHCGRCGTCVERREAFQRAGLPDPTDYLDHDPLPTGPRNAPKSR